MILNAVLCPHVLFHAESAELGSLEREAAKDRFDMACESAWGLPPGRRPRLTLPGISQPVPGIGLSHRSPGSLLDAERGQSSAPTDTSSALASKSPFLLSGACQ